MDWLFDSDYLIDYYRKHCVITTVMVKEEIKHDILEWLKDYNTRIIVREENLYIKTGSIINLDQNVFALYEKYSPYNYKTKEFEDFTRTRITTYYIGIRDLSTATLFKLTFG